jgi:hypothetical protein
MGEKMTLEQAFAALDGTTIRLQGVAVECSRGDVANAMREKARVHARAVATVKAHLATPAQTVDVEKVISECRELAKRWYEIDEIGDDRSVGLIQAANELIYRLDKLSQAIGDKT